MRRIATAAAALAAAWLIAACATTVPEVTDTGAALESNQGVIFGRIAVQKDGRPLTTDIYKNLSTSRAMPPNGFARNTRALPRSERSSRRKPP